VPVARSVRPHWFRRLTVAAVALALLLAASAFADAIAQVGLGSLRSAPSSGVFGWILTQQALFYRALSGLIHAAKTDGSAYWALMGISFVYGIFHAAGPGHGKAVISSYLLANEETWRRGIALSFAAALLQALTAIVLVAVVAVLIGATAKMMGDTVRVIEIVSYGLIMLLGARLLWIKGRGFLRALEAVRDGSATASAAAKADHDHRVHDSHCHHDHPHAHDHAGDHKQAYTHLHDDHRHDHVHHAHDHAGDHKQAYTHQHDEHGRDHLHHAHDHDYEESALPWGHAHGPEPEDLAGAAGWRRGLSAIVAVGLRPCSGAIIVLVFALAQGLFLAGIASTFVMGIGTAITVAAIATLAVAAKAVAGRFATTRAGYGTLALRGIEVGAALLIMLFGLLLLTGYMVSERMGLF
jgi:nickel/cobalt transporter (NicO) family protein